MKHKTVKQLAKKKLYSYEMIKSPVIVTIGRVKTKSEDGKI